MMEIQRDVIIVGAGPAGTICAAYLAKAGVDVLLLEKELFPREKACGDLQCEGFVSHIGQLGGFERLDDMGTCLRNIKLISQDGGEAVIPFESYATPRSRLDQLLMEIAVEWGAELRKGCRVTDVIIERGRIQGVETEVNGQTVQLRSKLVIGADGACSPVAKGAGLMREKSSAISLGQRAYFKGIKLEPKLAVDQYNAYGMFFFDELVKPGCFWIVPVGEEGVSKGFCNVGMMVQDRDSYKGRSMLQRFAQWKTRSDVAPLFQNARQISPWKGGKLTDLTQGIKPARNGLLLIGDAASVMMPMMHDGLSAAADSAAAAAKSAEEALKREDYSEEFLLERYRENLQKEQDPGIAKRSLKNQEEDPLKRKLKLTRLMVQSMYDSRTMNHVVQRLDRDESYRKRIAKEMQRP